MRRHLAVATWVAAIAAVIATLIMAISFLTGKNKLADLFSTSTDYRSIKSSDPNTEIENSRAIDKSLEIPPDNAATLEDLLDLATGDKITDLQAHQLTEALDGTTVILSGYLINARRSFLGASAEIAASKAGERTFYLNVDDSDKHNWTIPKGSYIAVQTRLRQPAIGAMIGDNARLVRVSKDRQRSDSGNP